MIIQLDKTTRIETDNLSWAICKVSLDKDKNLTINKKSGEPDFKAVAWYPDLKQLIEDYCEAKIKGFDLMLDKNTLNKIFIEIENLKSAVLEAVEQSKSPA